MSEQDLTEQVLEDLELLVNRIEHSRNSTEMSRDQARRFLAAAESIRRTFQPTQRVQHEGRVLL